MRMRMSRMKPSVIFCLALSALLVGLSRCAVRPVDGPGMERSPADYGHEADTVGGVDRVKAPGVQGAKENRAEAHMPMSMRKQTTRLCSK